MKSKLSTEEIEEEKSIWRSLYENLGGSLPSDAELERLIAEDHARKQLRRTDWYDEKALEQAKSEIELTPERERSDAEKDYLRFLLAIERSGLTRLCAQIPEPEAILALTSRFPNFAEPLRFLAEQAAFAKLRGDAEIHFIPLLLGGPAGVGKTHFAMALAEVFASRSEVLSMAAQSCGFALSGMDRGWSNGRPGLVFEALRHGATMSPLIVLDEIDKTNNESRSDPLGPLYTLLEPRSAKSFRDEFAGIPINAGQVLWIATANDINKVPTALLSRFRIFDIPEPTPTQLRDITAALYVECAAGLPGAPDRLPEAWLSRLAGQTPRAIRIAIQQALGKAALRAVAENSAGLHLEDDDLALAGAAKERRIGF